MNNIIMNTIEINAKLQLIFKRCSIIIVSNTSSPAQFMNSYDHERYHLVTHILEEFNIDPYSEETAYLTGNIGQLMFPKAKRFLCKCYCK